jgi:uncharacterized OsmC-like protein
MDERELKSVSTGNGFRVDITGERFGWILDEPVEDGGTGAGPTPVQALLGGLVGCLTVSFQYSARRKKVPIRRIEGWIAANEPGFLKQISIELQVWSPAPEEDVRALLPFAERGCYVKNVLKPELDYTIDLVVNASE